MSDAVAPGLTFEQARAELEQAVQDLEDGKIGLQEALERYEKGVSLLRYCYRLLHQAEQRILLLTGVDSEGKPILEPFAPTTGDPRGPQIGGTGDENSLSRLL